MLESQELKPIPAVLGQEVQATPGQVTSLSQG